MGGKCAELFSGTSGNGTIRSQQGEGPPRFLDKSPDQGGIFPPVGYLDARVGIDPRRTDLHNGPAHVFRCQATGKNHRLCCRLHDPSACIPVMGFAGCPAGSCLRVPCVRDEGIDMGPEFPGCACKLIEIPRPHDERLDQEEPGVGILQAAHLAHRDIAVELNPAASQLAARPAISVAFPR